jgi:hypothetical protein
MRDGCFDCVRKHIGQAEHCLTEAVLGYPRHFWWGIGHLAEAECESLRENRQVAREIRKVRLDYMNHSVQFIEGDYQGPSMDDLLGRVCELIGDVMYLNADPSNSKKFATESDIVDDLISSIRVPDPA